MARNSGAALLLTYLLSLLVLQCRAESDNSTLAVTKDGACGISSNTTCLNSTYGDCCSIRGFCGSTTDFCNPTAGCQSNFGSCSTNSSYISYDGKCGVQDSYGQVCIGSSYGSCCSQRGWCGSTADYCGTGCQSDFGTCGGANTTIENNPSADPASSDSTASASSGTGKAPNAAASSTQTQPSLLGLEIGVGVLAGVLVISSIVVGSCLLRRRNKRVSGVTQDEIVSEMEGCKCGGISIYEAPHPYRQRLSGIFGSILPRPPPVELGSPGHGRAELRGTYDEI